MPWDELIWPIGRMPWDPLKADLKLAPWPVPRVVVVLAVWPLPIFVALPPRAVVVLLPRTVVALLPWTVWAFCACIVAWLDRCASLTSLPRFSPLSCAILPQPCPPWCSATMLSKLWPVAFASRCAFSKLPQPRPVDALSACNVATGTPVAAEILSGLAAWDSSTF